MQLVDGGGAVGGDGVVGLVVGRGVGVVLELEQAGLAPLPRSQPSLASSRHVGGTDMLRMVRSSFGAARMADGPMTRVRVLAAVMTMLAGLLVGCGVPDLAVSCKSTADFPHRGVSGNEAGRVVGKLTVTCSGNVDVIETSVRVVADGVTVGAQVKGWKAVGKNYLQGVAATYFPCIPGWYETEGNFRTEWRGQSDGWNAMSYSGRMYVYC